MNAGGHLAVAAAALATGSRPELDDAHRAGYLLGSALPDLAAMGRFRLLGSTDDTAISEGIATHHRTDDLFHRHPVFVEANRSVREALTAAGVARGPAMACGHVGVELLLDGRLLVDAGVARARDAAFDAIGARWSALATLVPDPRRDAWRHHLERVAAWRLAGDYDDPAEVATRLHRILARRPRLALPADAVTTVADALAEQRPHLRARAPGLVTELAAAL